MCIEHHLRSRKSAYRGALLGLALGDALGAVYEGGLPERLLWKILGRSAGGRRRYTDDTQMTLDILESYMECGDIDQEDIARRFAIGYRFDRGYGRSTAHVLKLIGEGVHWRDASRSLYKEGSYGNGAAMRAASAALISSGDEERLRRVTIWISEITHPNPEAIEGAWLVARVTMAALENMPIVAIRRGLIHWSRMREYRDAFSKMYERDVAERSDFACSRLGNSTRASKSVPSAICYALEYLHRPFGEMMDDICGAGGDTDTIGAMAGAIWGAYNGVEAFGDRLRGKVENEERILSIADSIYDMS